MPGFFHSTVNLKLLRAFDAVARHRSFTKAAAELGRAQATLSAQVHDLEQQLGVTVLDRTTRVVSLTEAGEVLARSVATGFRTIDDGVSAARLLVTARRGRIILACVPSLSASRLPEILATYRARDQATRIDVEELTSSEVITALMTGTVDFGVGPCVEPAPPDIMFTPAVNEPLVVVLPHDANADEQHGISFKTLGSLALVTLSGSVLLQRTLEKAAREQGLRLVSHAEVRHVQTAVAMARAGLGAAIVPRLALPGDLGPDLRIAPIIDPKVSRLVGIITRRGKPLEKAAARLARHIRAALVRAMDEII